MDAVPLAADFASRCAFLNSRKLASLKRQETYFTAKHSNESCSVKMVFFFNKEFYPTLLLILVPLTTVVSFRLDTKIFTDVPYHLLSFGVQLRTFSDTSKVWKKNTWY